MAPGLNHLFGTCSSLGGLADRSQIACLFVTDHETLGARDAEAVIVLERKDGKELGIALSRAAVHHAAFTI